MNRLARTLKVANLKTKHVPAGFWDKLKTVQIAAGEFIAPEITLDTWIFVEEGCLILMGYYGEWRCSDIFMEGSSIGLHQRCTNQTEEGGLAVRAIKDSVIYYLTREDDMKMETIYPGFMEARVRMMEHFLKNYFKRKELFHSNPLDRIQKVGLRFPFLFKLPIDVLTEYLDIRSKPLKNTLAKAQKRYRVQRNVLRQPE